MSTSEVTQLLTAGGLLWSLDEGRRHIIGGTKRIEAGDVDVFEKAFVISGLPGPVTVHIAATIIHPDFEMSGLELAEAVAIVLSVYRDRGLLNLERGGLKALFQELEQFSILRLGPGSTAALFDENEPEGTVVVRDAKGNPRLLMPRSVWDDLRAWKPGKGA